MVRRKRKGIVHQPIVSFFNPIMKLPSKKRMQPMIELFFGPILSSMMPIGRAATLLTTTDIVKAKFSFDGTVLAT